MTTVIARMSKRELNAELRAIREVGKKIRKTPQSARSFLMKHGFITRSGKLTKRYGG
jgi:hypothetical protein